MLFFNNNFDTKKSPLNSNHVHVFYIHGIVIGLNLVYPWNKTAVFFQITIQGKRYTKRMHEKLKF